MSAPIESSETHMEEIRDNTDKNSGQDHVDEVQVDDASESITDTGDKSLSKSQLKKLKKKEKWEQVKAQKRKAEKERYKARKRECRERGEELGPTRKQLRHNKMSKSSCKIQVVIDCDFDDYMADKDIKMLVKQIQYSYSANRRAENPLQFYCCGVNSKTRERLENIGDYKGWDVKFRSESFTELFEKSSVVYLSSESNNMLETLEEDKVYVIGGLVDHNHHKGLSHRLAEERGLYHAQLPISDYIDMKTRKVLTVNHVFEILLRFTETKDWQKAFYAVLPQRKGAIPKSQNSEVSPSVVTNEDKPCSDKQTVKNLLSTAVSENLKTCQSDEEKTPTSETGDDCEAVNNGLEKEDSSSNIDSNVKTVEHLVSRKESNSEVDLS